MQLDAVIYCARIILAVVFATAAITKASNWKLATQAMKGFGLPAAPAGIAAAILPPVEFSVGVLLIAAAYSRPAAIAASALLALFMLVITANLARGRRPACNCFGQLQSTPIGWRTVARNAMFLAIALLIVAFEPAVARANAVAGLARALGFNTTTFTAALLAAAVLAFQTFLVWHLFRQNGRLMLRMDELERRVPIEPPQGLPVGSPAPAFTVMTSAGPQSGLQWLRERGADALLVFTDPKCQPCAELMPQLAAWQRDHGQPIVVVTKAEGQSAAQRHGLHNIVIQKDVEVAEAFAVPGTPGAVRVTPDGVISSGVALGQEAITRLLTVAAPEALVEARAS